jgi:integrase
VAGHAGVLELSSDVQPKTIRYTIATLLYETEWVPERQISEMLGHVDETGLARSRRVTLSIDPRTWAIVKALEEIWLRISR